MKSNLLLLLRALWQYPFGAGTLRSLSDDASLRSLSDDASLRSLADMWSHYITRLQGSETYGIPSRLSDLTDLPSAPLLVADRKMDVGSMDVPDGIGILGVIFGMKNDITYLEDTPNGLTYSTAAFVDTLRGLFPNMEELVIGCKYLTTYVMNRVAQSTLKKITFSNLEEATTTEILRFGNYGSQLNEIEELHFPKCKKMASLACNDGSGYDIDGLSELTTVTVPDLEEIPSGNVGRGYWLMVHCPKLETLDMSALTKMNKPLCYANCLPNLLLLKLGAMETNTNLSGWSPTLTNDNLEQFLSNFRTYIALRLTANGSGLTLTLSQAVFSSIWDANGNPQVLQDGLDQLRADIHNIVKTTKHWDVNKAN
jgi:hypothetical protein